MVLTIFFVLIVLLILSVRRVGRWFRNGRIRKNIGLLDIPFIGQRRGRKIPGAAVICGGSVAGLFAARICSDHFEEVILVEPEAWLTTDPSGCSTTPWDKSLKRTRVVQWRSLHAMQAFCLMALQHLFPGVIEEETRKSQARVGPADWKSSTWGNSILVPYFAYLNNDLPKTFFCSRAAFETILRRLTFSRYPNIRRIVGSVVGVTPDSSTRGKIHSVTINDRDKSQSIEASLVIDCTGPARSGLRWLADSGYGRYSNKNLLPLDKLQISYDARMRYSTLEFTITAALASRLPTPGGYANADSIYTCFTHPLKDHKNLYCLKIEGDRLYICTGAWGDIKLPTTLDGVIDYARSMVLDKPIPEWFFEFLDMLAEVEDTMTHSTVRIDPCSYVRYHQAADLPSNFIAIGDSVMRVNPIFGQGCTKALLGTLALNTLLCSTPSNLSDDFSCRFFAAQETKIGHIWDGTKTNDYSHTTTIPVPGESLSKGAFIRWYIRQLQILGFKDKWAGSALWHTNMFLAPPTDNFHPYLIWKVLCNWVVSLN